MPTIPYRFLGLAFSVGDVLLEVELPSMAIVNADGATSLLESPDMPMLPGQTLTDLLAPEDLPNFQAMLDRLRAVTRRGPLFMGVGPDEMRRRRFAVFMSRFDDVPNRLYLALTLAHRLGADPDQSGSKALDQDSEKFFSRLENLLNKEGGKEDSDLHLTVLETDAQGDDSGRAEFERRLSSQSLGGNYAARLAENRYAILYSDSGKEDPTGNLVEVLTRDLAMPVKAATLNPKDNLGARDTARAVIYGLQQFASAREGYDIKTLSDGFGKVVNHAADKVQMFRDILDRRQFTLVYQPIADMKTEIVHHYEVLARFDRDDIGKSPFETIRFAEQVGMIGEFDLSVIDRTLAGLRKLVAKGKPQALSLNISGATLNDEAIMEQIIKLLRLNQPVRDITTLEITESATIENLDAIAEVTMAIRQLGFHIHLDDFGAGLSGFQYLRKLDVDGVKIDGSYIVDAETDPKARAFLHSMVTLCQDLEIITVGEWVESPNQVRFLRSLGVDYGQGFYFGKPQPRFIPGSAEMLMRRRGFVVKSAG